MKPRCCFCSVRYPAASLRINYQGNLVWAHKLCAERALRKLTAQVSERLPPSQALKLAEER